MGRICWGRCRVPFTVTHKLSGNNALIFGLTNGNSALDLVLDLVTFCYLYVAFSSLVTQQLYLTTSMQKKHVIHNINNITDGTKRFT